MTHDEAFLADIAEHPADDAPRLIYADWLEEHGGAAEAARAAFIRGQCRLARMSFQDPARAALEDECSDLLAEHGEEWTAPVRSIAERWEFCRGFIERIDALDDLFLKHAEALTKQLPLRALTLELQETNGKALADCPQLERLETLEICNQHLRDGQLQLLASPHLKRLTALSLRGNVIEGSALEALLESNLLARLRRLDLSGNRSLGDQAIRSLVNKEQAARLEVLRLGGTGLTAAGLQNVFASRCLRRLVVLDVSRPDRLGHSNYATVLDSLARAAFLPQLVSLNLSSWSDDPHFSTLLSPVLQAIRLSALYLSEMELTEAGPGRLAEMPHLSGLTDLDLSWNEIGPRGCEALAKSPHLANLTTLNLRFNRIKDRGAKALASSPYLRQLRVLLLRRNDISDPGVTALARSSNLGNLRWLSVAGNEINTTTVRSLARSPHLKQLLTLDLGDTGLAPDSAEALTQQSQLERLERLFLDSNDLRDNGVAALAAAPTLRRLKLLNLRDNHLGKAGAEALAASPHLGRLTCLDVSENNLTGDALRLLRQRFGKAVQDDNNNG